MFHSLNCLQKKLKFLAKPCSIWKELNSFNFPKLKMLAWKTQSTLKLIQSRKRSKLFESFIDQKACLKNWLFGELFQSRKWIEIVHNFKARNYCLAKLKFFANRFSIKENWLSQFFKAWVACMKKEAGTNFVYGTKWKKKLMEIFRAEIACLKASTFSQTDSNYETNWSTPKVE